jgi:hypothetical protein
LPKLFTAPGAKAENENTRKEAWDKDPFERMKESFNFFVSCGLEA